MIKGNLFVFSDGTCMYLGFARLIKERYQCGKTILSLMYPLPRAKIAEILVSTI